MKAAVDFPEPSTDADLISPRAFHGAAIQESNPDPDAPKGLFESARLNQAMGMYLPATVVVRLVNFARVLLLTWWMLPQQFGLLNMILLAINVLIPLCSLGLNEAVTRYVPQEETRGSVRAFAFRSFVLLLVVTGASALLMCVFSSELSGFFYAQISADARIRTELGPAADRLARVSAGVTGLVIIYFFLLAVFKGLRMFKAVALMEIVHALMFLAACTGAGLLDRRSAIHITTLYGLSLAVPIGFFGLAFANSLGRWRTQGRPTEQGAWIGKLLRFSVWTTLAGVTWQVLVYYPSWYLNKLHGHAAVAVFTAPRQIGQFILIGAVAVATVAMTTVTKTWERKGREAAKWQLSMAFRGTGLALLVLCAVMSLTRNWIMLMFRPDYMPGADILPLHLLFFLIAAYLSFLAIHFHLIERTRHLFWPWAVGVGTNVLFAYWLAGPGGDVVRGSTAWNWAASASSGWFITGFSSPQGLDCASWCGVFSIATALLLCVGLIRAECTRLDRGTYIIMFAAVLLGMTPWILAAGTLLLIGVACRTDFIFTKLERQLVHGYLLDTLRHVPVPGRRRNRGE